MQMNESKLGQSISQVLTGLSLETKDVEWISIVYNSLMNKSIENFKSDKDGCYTLGYAQGVNTTMLSIFEWMNKVIKYFEDNSIKFISTETLKDIFNNQIKSYDFDKISYQ